MDKDFFLESNKETFINALRKNDKDTLNKLPKSDLHIHSTRGCSRKYFEDTFNTKFPNVPRFNSILDMDNWYNTYIDMYTKDLRGFKMRMESLLEGFKNNNVVISSPIYCLHMIKFFDYNLDEYLKYLNNIISSLAPNLKVLPEFEVHRGEDPDKVLENLHNVSKYNFYHSIDLCGDELLGTKNYQEVYKYADEIGLVLKAHVGEFTDARYIDEALEYLNLDAITHGISLSKSKELMNYVRDKEIMINCCPSSNYYLKRVNSYKEHPIKEFVRNGITCSINTDDEIIFNQDINDEYLNLYNSGCLKEEELYEVNQNGLKKYLNKRRK